MTRYRASRKPIVNPQGPWLRVSHEATWAFEDITDTQDIVVKISPDAGYDDSAFDNNGNLILWTREDFTEEPEEKIQELLGTPKGEQHPGVTFPQLGIVEINAQYVPEEVDPETMHPLRHSDHARYPVVWGLVHHEGAHVDHSDWMTIAEERRLQGEEAKWFGAATILEESRIEKIHVDTRPESQKWLQASGMNLALEEITREIGELKKLQEEDPDVDVDKPAIARAAALVLARIDAGSVIKNDSTEAVERLVLAEFGGDVYREMQRIWREVHETGDNDTDRMLDLGRQWYELTGDAGNAPQEMIVVNADLGELGEALRDAASQAVKEANGQADIERRRAKINLKVLKAKEEGEARAEAQQKASGVFAGEGDSYDHPVKGYRDPTAQEMTLARLARRWLEAAYVPERAVTRVNSQLPPGRLETRAALQGDAQRAAGLQVSTEPFRHKERRHVPTPPLKVGIIQDVSGSQGGPAAAAVSGAWSLAKGTEMIEDSTLAMVTFGDAVHAVFKPGVKMPKVPLLSTDYGTRYFAEAVQAIDGVLHFTRRDSARLLVILTDGYFHRGEFGPRDKVLKRLTDLGVKVLWLRTYGDGDEYLPGGGRMPGVHVTDAAGNNEIIPKLIVTEAVNALRK